MIALVLLIVFVSLLFAIPWRQLPAVARGWALIACLNALVFFSLPTTAATSPWRPIVTWVVAICAGLSLVSMVVGLWLQRRYAGVTGSAASWLTPMIIGGLPSALYILFSLLGPFY